MMPRIITTVAAVLVLAGVLQSQTKPKESLRGLNGVYLYVHPLDKDVEAGGLTAMKIKNAVETQLRSAGIPIHNEPNPANGSANLAILVNTLKHPQGVYLYDVGVSLLQEVRLTRLSAADSFPAQTWSTKALGLTTANRMDIMLEPIRAKVDDFISDYTAVNPKTHP
jgi:hypothetical protein